MLFAQVNRTLSLNESRSEIKGDPTDGLNTSLPLSSQVLRERAQARLVRESPDLHPEARGGIASASRSA
jgi:hypothetical protein